MIHRVRFAGLPAVFVLASCGAEPSATMPPAVPIAASPVRGTTQPSDRSITPTNKSAELATRRPKWTLAASQKPGAAFGPFGLSQVVALADGERGFLVGGVRHRTRGEAIEAVPTSGEEVSLSRVVVLTEKLGGGVLFVGRGGVYRARTFDGPLRKIAPVDEAASTTMLGHGVVLVGNKAYDWNTGKARPADAEARVIVHPDGYSVTIARGRARFSKDGTTSTDLAIDGVSFAAIGGAGAILLQVKDDVFSLNGGGKLTREPSMHSVLVASAKATPQQPFDVASMPAALAGSAWVDVPGSEGRKAATYRSGELVTVDRESGQVAHLAPSVKRDDCGLVAQGQERLLLCGGFAEDRSMSVDVYRIDLLTGDVVLERSARIEPDALRGATFVGVANGVADGAFVLTQRTCEGEANTTRMCVRRQGGTWINVELPRNSRVFPFLEGVYAITLRAPRAPDGGDGGARVEQLVVRDLERGAEVVFDAGVQASSMRALGLDPTRSAREQMLLPTSPTSRGAMVPRAGVVRTFEGAGPLSADARRLFVVDYRLATKSIAVRTLDGEFALAERRLLRLNGGALTESGDGGDTWVDVEPPPTGAPKTLEGALCTLNGCMLDPWVRVGWATR